MDGGSSQILYFSASQRGSECPLFLPYQGCIGPKTQSNNMAVHSCHWDHGVAERRVLAGQMAP